MKKKIQGCIYHSLVKYRNLNTDSENCFNNFTTVNECLWSGLLMHCYIHITFYNLNRKIYKFVVEKKKTIE